MTLDLDCGGGKLGVKYFGGKRLKGCRRSDVAVWSLGVGTCSSLTISPKRKIISGHAFWQGILHPGLRPFRPIKALERSCSRKGTPPSNPLSCLPSFVPLSDHPHVPYYMTWKWQMFTSQFLGNHCPLMGHFGKPFDEAALRSLWSPFGANVDLLWIHIHWLVDCDLDVGEAFDQVKSTAFQCH